MFKRSLVALSIVTLLAGAGVAFAQDQAPPARSKGAHGARMQQRLGLSDDQMNVVKGAFAKYRDELNVPSSSDRKRIF